MTTKRPTLARLLSDAYEAEPHTRALAIREMWERLAFDRLTRLNTFDHFYDLLSNRIKEWSEFTVMFLDVKGLGEMNRTHGHSAGDSYLKMAAEGIKLITEHNNGISCRRSGDEFLIAFEGAGFIHPNDEILDVFNAQLFIFPENEKDVDNVLFSVDANFRKE